MKKLLNPATIRLFVMLGAPIALTFLYMLVSLTGATPENAAYLLQAVPLMVENGLAALTVLTGGGLLLDIAKKKNGDRT